MKNIIRLDLLPYYNIKTLPGSIHLQNIHPSLSIHHYPSTLLPLLPLPPIYLPLNSWNTNHILILIFPFLYHTTTQYKSHLWMPTTTHLYKTCCTRLIVPQDWTNQPHLLRSHRLKSHWGIDSNTPTLHLHPSLYLNNPSIPIPSYTYTYTYTCTLKPTTSHNPWKSISDIFNLWKTHPKSPIL